MVGGHGVATPTARDAVVEGIHNLMRHMGMQEGEIVPQTVVPAHLRLDNLHRSMSYPCAAFLAHNDILYRHVWVGCTKIRTVPAIGAGTAL